MGRILTQPAWERGCVADQPQRICTSNALRLVEDDTAALRVPVVVSKCAALMEKTFFLYPACSQNGDMLPQSNGRDAFF